METRRLSPWEIPPKLQLPISRSATWLRLSSAMTASTCKRHNVQEGWSLLGCVPIHGLRMAGERQHTSLECLGHFRTHHILGKARLLQENPVWFKSQYMYQIKINNIDMNFFSKVLTATKNCFNLLQGKSAGNNADFVGLLFSDATVSSARRQNPPKAQLQQSLFFQSLAFETLL